MDITHGVFYISRYTKNTTIIAGYFADFESAHKAIKQSRDGNYDEAETTGNIYYQAYGLDKEPRLICSRHGDVDILEDYYDENKHKVKTLRYHRRVKTQHPATIEVDMRSKRMNQFGY